MRNREICPGGCYYCGLPKYNHCQVWHGPGIGIGGFVPPTQEQIKERMRARRQERLNPTVESYEDDFEEVNISMEFGLPSAD